jgi:hypothetical protein
MTYQSQKIPEDIYRIRLRAHIAICVHKYKCAWVYLNIWLYYVSKEIIKT